MPVSIEHGATYALAANPPLQIWMTWLDGPTN
jgi:hypothetical protein